jgi:hypothetical protein
MSVPAAAGDNDGPAVGGGQGVCEPDGAWFGHVPAWGLEVTWVTDSDSHWVGKYSMQFYGGDPSFGGLLPATIWSPTTGTVVRTGRRSFEYTHITYGLGTDPIGNTVPIYIAKAIGVLELSEGCTVVNGVSLSVELFAPNQDPFGEEPPAFGCYPDASPISGRRMTVDPPCEP